MITMLTRATSILVGFLVACAAPAQRGRPPRLVTSPLETGITAGCNFGALTAADFDETIPAPDVQWHFEHHGTVAWTIRNPTPDEMVLRGSARDRVPGVLHQWSDRPDLAFGLFVPPVTRLAPGETIRGSSRDLFRKVAPGTPVALWLRVVRDGKVRQVSTEALTYPGTAEDGNPPER